MGFIDEKTALSIADFVSKEKKLEKTDGCFFAGFMAGIYALMEESKENIIEAYLAYYDQAMKSEGEELQTGHYVSEEFAKAIGHSLATNEKVASTNAAFYAGYMAGIFSLAEQRKRPILEAYLRYYDISLVTAYMKMYREAGHEN